MNVRRTSTRLWLLLSLFAATSAFAGRRPFLFGQDSAMVPDGDVEIETWLDYRWNRPIPAGMGGAWAPSQWLWWVGPRWSPIEGVEVSALTSIAQDDQSAAAPNPPSTAQLWAELFTARWRVVNDDSVGSVSLQLDFRLPLASDLLYQLSPSVGWAKHAGRFGFTAQAGYAAGFRANDRYNWIVWNAGASVDAIRGEVWPVLQFGVEAFSEVVIGSGTNDISGRKTTVNVGPTVSVARGRLWFTVGALFGLTQDSPLVYLRGVLGVAL